MSNGIVQGSGIAALAARMRRVAKDMDDLSDLGRKIRPLIAEGNKDDRLAGRNRFGHKMPAVSSKLQKGRDRKSRGRGPFLAPGPGRDPARAAPSPTTSRAWRRAAGRMASASNGAGGRSPGSASGTPRRGPTSAASPPPPGGGSARPSAITWAASSSDSLRQS